MQKALEYHNGEHRQGEVATINAFLSRVAAHSDNRPSATRLFGNRSGRSLAENYPPECHNGNNPENARDTCRLILGRGD
jgi:hypothetical protein